LTKKPKKPVNWAHEAWQIFLLLLAVFGIHSAIAKPFYIPSESMLPTLLVGDRLVVTKYPYGFSWMSPSLKVLPPMEGRLFGRMPERGDVVVIKQPGTYTDFIKRLIGLPGDIVQMKRGQLFINGEAVRHERIADATVPVDQNSPCIQFSAYRRLLADGREVCAYPQYRETLPNGVSYVTLDAMTDGPTDDTQPFIVPDGHIFVMGDNRDNSADSRVPVEIGGVGILPLENLVGRADFTTFSLDGTNQWFNPLTWPGALRNDRWFESLHPDEATAG
jgi:signal peptidase I